MPYSILNTYYGECGLGVKLKQLELIPTLYKEEIEAIRPSLLKIYKMSFIYTQTLQAESSSLLMLQALALWSERCSYNQEY